MVHRVEKVGRHFRPVDGHERTAVADREKVWRLLAAMEAAWPERDILFHLIALLGVCPEGMITDSVRLNYLVPERMSDTYKSPPGPTLDTWPALLYDAFNVIRTTHQACENDRMKRMHQAAEERTRR